MNLSAKLKQTSKAVGPTLVIILLIEGVPVEVVHGRHRIPVHCYISRALVGQIFCRHRAPQDLVPGFHPEISVWGGSESGFLRVSYFLYSWRQLPKE